MIVRLQLPQPVYDALVSTDFKSELTFYLATETFFYNLIH